MGLRAQPSALAVRREGSRVVRQGNAIEKYHPQDFQAELEKHGLIFQALSGSDTVFPALLSNDGVTRLVMEDLGELISLRESYLAHMTAPCESDDGTAILMRQAGAALALIHAIDPSAPSTPERHAGRIGPAGLTLEGSDDPVLLHGDYGFNNVLTQQRTGKLAVIDPSPNYFVTTYPLELGSPLVDLGNFTSGLMGLVPPRNFAKMKWHRAATLIEHFLSGYETASNRRIPRSHLIDVAEQTARSYFGYKYSDGLRQILATAWFRNRRKRIEADLLRLQA